MSDDALRYPVGRFTTTEATQDQVRHWIEEIAALPALLRATVDGWDEARLDTPYRPGGWTVRQVVHHLADSHMNAFVRMRLALTEDAPVIKPYDERGWAELPDVAATPPEVSLVLLESLHRRWATMLAALPASAFARVFVHPENGETRLDRAVGLYAWHGRHHRAHLSGLAARMGW